MSILSILFILFIFILFFLIIHSMKQYATINKLKDELQYFQQICQKPEEAIPTYEEQILNHWNVHNEVIDNTHKILSFIEDICEANKGKVSKGQRQSTLHSAKMIKHILSYSCFQEDAWK